MGVQVSKEIRSRLEYCTLEELLTDDKVISFKLLGEPRRLTACSILQSFNSISQSCLRDRKTTLLKFYHYGRKHHPETVIYRLNPIHHRKTGIHRPRTETPEHPNSGHYGQLNPKTSPSLRVLQRHSDKTIVISYSTGPKMVSTLSPRQITTTTRVV
jgi:hypothetical protein